MVPVQCRPSSLVRAEVNLTALFCAFCQAFTSYLLLVDFMKTETENIEESSADVVPALESRTTILVKFICAILFHFKFETEISSSLSMMKYAAIHSDDFVSPLKAFFMGFVNMIIIVMVEVINLWNLSNITEGGVNALMFDFIALGIIAEFDDYFVEIYMNSDLDPLIEDLVLTFERTKRPKRRLPDMDE